MEEINHDADANGVGGTNGGRLNMCCPVIFEKTMKSDEEVFSYTANKVFCALCKDKDPISLRRDYYLDYWFQHKETKRHSQERRNIDAAWEREKKQAEEKGITIKRKQQATLLNMFTKKPKKTTTDNVSESNYVSPDPSNLQIPKASLVCGGALDHSDIFSDQLGTLKMYSASSPWFTIRRNPGAKQLNIHDVHCPTGEVSMHKGMQRCNNCVLLRQSSKVKKFYSRTKAFAEKMQNIDAVLCRQTVSEAEVNVVASLTTTNDELLTELGQTRKEECKALLKYHRSIQKLAKEKELKDCLSADGGKTIIGHDKVLSDFMKIYTGPHGSRFKSSLLHSLLSVFMVCV